MTPSPEAIARFRRDIAPLAPPDMRLGIAVSGGPDSLALLLLAAAARPGVSAAATVDHKLREGSRAEAEMVASLCAKLGVPHNILTVEWEETPATAIQERARDARYVLLARWVESAGLDALVTAHQLDDQAETFLMRLARGAGVKGLAGMRRLAVVPGADMPLIRPLLGWRRDELEQICAEAGIEPAIDPGNADDRFERVRMRRAIAQAGWLYPRSVAQSASHLEEAEAALHWAVAQEWDRAVTRQDRAISYRPGNAPREIRRRIVRRAILQLATEGQGADLRGRELDPLLDALADNGRATLRGVLCTGGAEWRFVPAPDRTRPVDNLR